MMLRGCLSEFEIRFDDIAFEFERDEFTSSRGRMTRKLRNRTSSETHTLHFDYLICNSIEPALHARVHEFPAELPNSEGVSIGHRGWGSNRVRKDIQENSLLSFEISNRHRIEWVEFDVQPTLDNQLAIYHDYTIGVPNCPIGKSQIRANAPAAAEQVKIPIRSLNLDQIVNWDNTIWRNRQRRRRSLDNRGISSEFGSVYEFLVRDRIPTLLDVLTCVRSNLNIEIKYPVREALTARYNFPERNDYVDLILGQVLPNCNRPMYFSCFDPDTCVLLATKQDLLPVFFLTDAGQPGGDDARSRSLEIAIEFAIEAGLRGIVSVSNAVIERFDLVNRAHEFGLLVYTYGKENNDADLVKLQLDHGVDAIIADLTVEVNKKLALYRGFQ
jgi:glycerophosphoryl diester phosphodiesterase